MLRSLLVLLPVTLADGRDFFLFAGAHDGRWYVLGAQAQHAAAISPPVNHHGP